jgi:hypothetical protein
MPLSFQSRRRHKIIFQKCGSDFVILLLKITDWEWMNPSRTSETVLLSKKKKRRYCRDGIRIAIMQIYDQEKNGGKFRIESEVERDKMIVSLPKTPKMDENVNVLIIEDTPAETML